MTALPERGILQGKIIRKKKRPDSLVLAVKPLDQKSIPIHVSHHDAYEFLHLNGEIRVEWYRKRDSGDLWAKHITLVRCTPTPTMIPTVMQGVVNGVYPPSVLPGMTVEEMQKILNLPIGRQKRVSIAEISRVLEGKEAYKPPRRRLPFVKKREWVVLEELERIAKTGEHGWKLQSIAHKKYENLGNEAAWENLPLNIPEAPVPLPDRGPRPSREHYLLHKKIPQVRWMVNRVKEMYRDREPPRHILDVGGGRGDLATALALALPTTKLTVVDVNQPSLDAGKDYASSRGCGVQITFILEDMAKFVKKDIVSPPIDLVVALHACGDLSDLAMSYASKIGADFVICPCCYGKRHILEFTPGWEGLCNETTQSTLRRLSELNEQKEVCRLAMQYINSMRFQCLEEDNFCVLLDQYDVETSIRNHVFVATR